MAPSPSALRRFESLDHWRGLACLLVIIYHSTIVYLVTNPAARRHRPCAARTHSSFQRRRCAVLCDQRLLYRRSRRQLSRATRSHRHILRSSLPPDLPAVLDIVVCTIAVFFLLDYGWRAPLLSGQPWPQYRPNWYSPTQWFGNLTLIETWRHHMFGSIRGTFHRPSMDALLRGAVLFRHRHGAARVAPLVLPWHRGRVRGDGARRRLGRATSTASSSMVRGCCSRPVSPSSTGCGMQPAREPSLSTRCC